MAALAGLSRPVPPLKGALGDKVQPGARSSAGGTPATAPCLMPAMRRKRAAIPARLHRAGHIEWAMPSQDCLFIRLSDYFEARRHRPDRDEASKALADEQAPQSAEARRPGQEGSVSDQGR